MLSKQIYELSISPETLPVKRYDIFKLFILLYFICMVFCLHMCLCTLFMLGAHVGQKRV